MAKFDWRETRFVSLSELANHLDLEERHADGMDDRSAHESWLKGQFRKSTEWKWFCESIVEKRKVCERCGSDGDGRGLHVHHLDPRNYRDLNETKFRVLCDRCHLQIESFCVTEDSMKRCPKKDRDFLTLYPYRETDKDVLAKGSGQFWKRKLNRELDEANNPGKWVNVEAMSSKKKGEVKDALKFMREHPELFGGR